MDDRTATQAGRVLPLPPAPDGIDLRHLRAFVAVAEELNFGRAAARLYLSQPALSRQIRGLERLVGCDLLRRSTHQVELTLAGDALLDRARELLHGVDDAVSATRAVGGELAGRLARIWEPVNDLTSAGADLQELPCPGARCCCAPVSTSPSNTSPSCRASPSRRSRWSSSTASSPPTSTVIPSATPL